MNTKRARNKSVSLGTIDAYGATAAEARANLNTIVEAAVSGSYEPAFISHGGHSAVVFRTPNGWEYQLFGEWRPLPTSGVHDVSGTCMMGNVTRAGAVASAAQHVVGLDGVDYHTYDDFPDWFTDRESQDCILKTRRFNRAYQWAKTYVPEIATDSNKLHAYACDHDSEPRFA